jgi:hypothetical protein
MTEKRKNEYLVGFEIECIIDNRVFSEDQLDDVLREINPGIRQHEEGSIEFGDLPIDYDRDPNAEEYLYTTEIVTPPLTTTEAFEVLAKVFKVIHKAGYTNVTTGLHVNISPVNKEWFKKMNYLYIAYHPIFREIAKAFDREDNDFCTPNDAPDKASELWLDIITGNDAENIYSGKDAAVNFDYITGGNFTAANAHIEVRAFGNAGYHRRLVEVRNYVIKVLEVFNKSMKVNFDYLK